MALDPYLRPEVSSSVKTEDKELAKIQAFVLDALAPLTAILEGENQPSEVTNATKAGHQSCGAAN